MKKLNFYVYKKTTENLQVLLSVNQFVLILIKTTKII